MSTSRQRNSVVLTLLIGLAAWYSLSFLGIAGLVGAWNLTDGLWFYLAAALGIGLLVGTYALWKGHAWGDWQLLLLLCIWLYLQYQSHWRPFFFPPPSDRIQGYYANFPYWYLLPKSSNRVVPDGFHTIMHILIMALIVLILTRVARQVNQFIRTRRTST